MGFKVDDVFVEFTVEFGDAERRVKRINLQLAKLGKVSGVAADSQDRMERSTRKAGKAAKKTAKEVSAQERATKKLGQAAKRVLVTLLGFEAVRRLFVGLTTVLVKFETRMAEVSTIAGKTTGKMRRLSQEILDLSRTVPQTADELGAGAYQVFSAGITDAADAMDVLTASSKAAVGGVTSTLVAVDAITTILNAYGMEANQATRVSDVLFQTVKGGKINFDQLSAGIGIVAKQASVMGVEFEEVSAAIAAITQATGRPRAAFTELAGLFRSIVAQEEASQKAAAELGIEWNLAALQARGLSGILADLNAATDGNATAIRKVVREDEGFRAAVVLSANGARGLRTQLEGMEEASGAAETAFQTLAATTDNQAKIAINNFNASLLELRDLILPAVTAELQGLIGIMDLFRSVELRRPAALATVQTLAASLDNLTGESRLGAIRNLRSALNTLMGGGGAAGGALSDVEKFQGTLRQISDEELVAMQQGFRALSDEAERFVFFTKQFSAINEEFRRRKLDVEAEVPKPPLKEPLKDPALTPAQIARRLALEEDLAERVREISLTTAEQQIEMVARLREAYRKEFGTISADVEAQFVVIEAAAKQALSVETARRLGEAFRTEINRALQQIEFEAVDIVDAEERTLFIQEQQVKMLEAKVAEAKDFLDVTGNTTEEEEELRKVLVDTVALLRRATKEKITQAELDAKAKREAQERLRDSLATLNLIKQSVDGALDFARAMGVVNDEMADTIQSLSQIAVGIATLVKGIGTGDPLSIISGGLSVLGGLGGLFSGPEADRREELLRQNNEALELLRQEYARSLSIFEQVPGVEFQKALDLLARGRTEITPGGDDPLSGITESVFRANLTTEQLAFLEQLAETLGVVFNITAEGFERLRVAIEESRLTDFTETFTGSLSLLQRRFELFDVDDPADRLTAMLDLLRDFGGLTLPSLELGSETGRAALEELIRTLFTEIEGGTFDVSRLGALTLEQLLDLLGNMEELLDDIGDDGVTTDEGLTENFVRSTRITEVQGNELLTLARTELVVERQQLAAQLEMVNLLGTMAAISAPAPGAVGTDMAQAAAVNVGGVTLNATIVITEEVDADTIIERVGTNLAVVVDRQLRELQTREDRAVGDTGRVA